MSKYLLELGLPHASMLAFAPSLQAAAAVCVSREIYGVAGGWTPTLAYYTGYSSETVGTCVAVLRGIVRDSVTSPHQAVQRKWNHSRFYHLSVCNEIQAYIAELSAAPEAGKQ